MDKPIIILIAISIIIIVELGVIIFQVYYNDQPKLKEINFTENCSGLNLVNTSMCLKKELKEFYHYNLSNKGKDLDFETLKIEGGVCEHYSNWYSSRAKELGFNVKEVYITLDNKTAHQFAVISNIEGYCILDQMKVRCI